MSMPKAAMYKHYGTVPREDDIWAAWHVGSLQSISEAVGVKEFANQRLRLCVFTPDTSHDPAALNTIEHIGHVVTKIARYAWGAHPPGGLFVRCAPLAPWLA